MREARGRRRGGSPAAASAAWTGMHRRKGGGLLLGWALLFATGCDDAWDDTGMEPSPPAVGSLRIGVQALDEELAEVEVTLIPSKAPALPPVSLQPTPGGGAWSQTLGGIRQGHYIVKARAFDAAQQQRFREASAPVVVLAGVQNQVDLFFAEERSGSEQAPHFVSIGYSGQPVKSSPFRFHVTGGGGEGSLALSGSGPGSFAPAATDPHTGSHLDWAVPAQEGPVSVTLTLEDEAGRKAHTRLDLVIVGISCNPGEEVCDGVCVTDTDTNPLRCGPSCQDCGADGKCMRGICRPDPELAGWPIPADAPPNGSYQVETDTVTDKVTGLMWEKTPGGPSLATFLDAYNYCETLVLAGHDDWRLPTRMESLSLVSTGTVRSINQPVFGSYQLFDWTSSVYKPDPNLRWVVSFDIPGRAAAGETLTHAANTRGRRIRCVRFTEDSLEVDGPRYVDDTDTVLDNWTSLRWEKNASATPLSHSQALTACGVRNGFQGRLPRKKELESLVDPYRNPALNPLFGPAGDFRYWSSTVTTRKSGTTRYQDVEEKFCVGDLAAYTVTGEGRTRARCISEEGGGEATERVRCVWDQ